MADQGNTVREPSGGPDSTPPRIPDHELLHPIGRGSYGEVWLARNATGTLRAVKVVHRARFDDERPYEREFTGLKHFEPISRTHEGLVDILQVGRNDAEGFFYYIMEAADSQDAPPPVPTTGAGSMAGHEPDPATRSAAPTINIDPAVDAANYRPCTLESRIRSEGRLPAAECIRICAILADALHSLHKQGLVHRDIKPSNIIFVEGIPKLADVGLVARSDSARTFVGTEGFVPPEGPGTAQADIYSLGKCLYEMAMGKDRQSFPSPPTLLEELPDREQLLELNEILDRACAPQARDRYANAAALCDDLTWLQNGGSIRKRRRNGRNLLLASLITAALLALVGAIVRMNQHQLEVAMDNPPPPGFRAGDAWIGHYNQDGEPGLYFGSDQKLCITSLDGVTFVEANWTGTACDHFDTTLIADVDHDGSDNLIAQTVSGTNVAIRVFNRKLLESISRSDMGGFGRREDTNQPPLPCSYMKAHRFYPATKGLPDRILTETGQGYAKLPRRFRMLSLDSDAKVLWEFPMASSGATIRNAVATTDLDGDGLEDFVIGTYSGSNAVSLPDGRDDYHSDILILSHHGKLLGRFVTGGPYMVTEPWAGPVEGRIAIFARASRAILASLDSQSVTNGPDANQPPEGHLYRLGMDGKPLASWSSTNAISSFLVTKIARFEHPVVLATDASGYLMVLSCDALAPLLPPMLITPKVLDFVELRLVAAEDLDGDGHNEIILLSAQERFGTNRSIGRPDDPLPNGISPQTDLLILNDKLKPVATRAFPTRRIGAELPKVFVTHSPTRKTPQILVEDKNLVLLNYR